MALSAPVNSHVHVCFRDSTGKQDMDLVFVDVKNKDILLTCPLDALDSAIKQAKLKWNAEHPTEQWADYPYHQ